MSLWSDLIGTTRSFFRIGFAGPRLKGNGGALDVRNAGDTAHVDLTAAVLKATGDSIEINADAADTGTDRKLTIARNAAASAGLTLVAPPAKGTDGYVLRQKAGTAAGVLELELVAPAAGDSGTLIVETTALAFGSSSPLALFDLPATGVIDRITIVIDTAFNGSPSLSIGISGQASKYAAATDIDLTQPAGTVIVLHPGLAAPGTVESLIATYAAGGASAGAARIVAYFTDAPV
jgi:hypothetical protein